MVIVNIAIVLTIGLVIQLLGLGPVLAEMGTGTQGLLTICVVWGMTGSFISLFISKWMAKRMMGVKILDAQAYDSGAQQLIATVHRLARQAGLTTMPEVGVYESPEINAFATGPSKNNSLVAVSSGLLHKMKTHEVEGVLAHEVAHIQNGDMVTMTLVQGMVNSFVLFLTHLVTNFILRGDDEEGRGSSFFMHYIVHSAVYSIIALLAMPIVSAFSRWREYRADAGGARLAGKDRMISALRALQGTENLVDNREAAFSSFKISGKKHGFLAQLFMSHPPLEDRIQRLNNSPIA